MSIFRVRASVTGFTGGPGLMTQYFSPAVAGFNEALAQLSVDRVRDALIAGSNLWGSPITWTIDGTVDELEETTGTLVDSLTVTPRSVSGTSANTGIGPAPAGAVVSWKTADVKAGKRVQGRTFLVPLNDAAFQSDGTLSTATLTEAGEFATAMGDAGATDLVHVVWSRPRPGVAGSKHGITGYTVPDKAAVLRSRRD